MKRWLLILVILLACSVAAGAEKPHIVIFSTSTCSPCNRLKQDFAVSPNLAPIAQAAWVSYLPPSDSRAKAYGFTGMVPLIVVLEPTDRGTYQECYRQVGYDGDAAKLSQNLYGCGLLRHLFNRDRSPRPGPNPGPGPGPGPGPTPDGDDGGDTIPIPDEGGTIPIPGDGPAPNPADDPITPPVVPPVTPGCTPQPCPADCDCRQDAAELRQEIAALKVRIEAVENGRFILQTVDTSGKVIQEASAPIGKPLKLRLVPVSGGQ